MVELRMTLNRGTIRVMPQLPETYPDELSMSAQTMDPTGSLSMTPDN